MISCNNNPHLLQYNITELICDTVISRVIQNNKIFLSVSQEENSDDLWSRITGCALRVLLCGYVFKVLHVEITLNPCLLKRLTFGITTQCEVVRCPQCVWRM